MQEQQRAMSHNNKGVYNPEEIQITAESWSKSAMLRAQHYGFCDADEARCIYQETYGLPRSDLDAVRYERKLFCSHVRKMCPRSGCEM